MYVSHEPRVELRVQQRGLSVLVACDGLRSEQVVLGQLVERETPQRVQGDTLRQIDEPDVRLHVLEKPALLDLGAELADEEPALVLAGRRIAHDPLPHLQPGVDGLGRLGAERQRPWLAALTLPDGDLQFAAAVVVHLQGQCLPNAARAVDEQEQHRVVAGAVEEALHGGEVPHVGVGFGVPVVADCLKEGDHLFVGGHVAGGLRRGPHLVLRQRRALDQVVSGAPLEERLGADTVAAERGRGDRLAALSEVAVHVALAESVEWNRVLVGPFHELPELDGVKSFGLWGAVGAEVDQELSDRLVPGVTCRSCGHLTHLISCHLQV